MLLVLACREHGDAWQEVSMLAIHTAIAVALEGKIEPVHSMNGNPFCRPDFHDLVKLGCAEWVGEPGAAGTLIRFTQRGFDGLRKAVRR